MPKPPPEHHPRPLSTREREVLTTLLQRGTSTDHDRPVTPADRTRWLAQVPQTLAGRPCGCGTCPSIELLDAAGRTVASRGRVVLEAGAPGALLLVFIDEDRPSYLELAPLDDVTRTDFPDTTDVHTA